MALLPVKLPAGIVGGALERFGVPPVVATLLDELVRLIAASADPAGAARRAAMALAAEQGSEALLDALMKTSPPDPGQGND